MRSGASHLWPEGPLNASFDLFCNFTDILSSMKDRLQELREIIQIANVAIDLSEYIPFEKKLEDTLDNNGLSPLHMAIYQNNLKMVKTMVQDGGNLEERSLWSKTLYLEFGIPI